jgi:hypothetical protein
MKSVMAMVLSLLFLGEAPGGELEEREMLRQQSATAFNSSNFDELERLADTYRTGQDRTESGTWKLIWFYRGIVETAIDFEKDDDANWSAAMGKIEQWAERYPQSPAPHIAYAGALTSRAWEYRGDGYASTIDPADLPIFIDFLEKAGEYLVQHEDTASVDPYWYYQVAWVYRGLGVDKTELLKFVEQGFLRHPDFDELYFTTAGYLAPKWHGSAEDIESFARESWLRTNNRRGTELYTRIYWAAGLDRDSQYFMHKSPAKWSLIARGMGDIVSRYPSQWNINHFAYFACVKEDGESAKKYLQMIVEPIVVSAWHQESNYKYCKRKWIRPVPPPIKSAANL